MVKFDKEERRPIKGYEGLYSVSNLGNVYSFRLNRNLELSKDKSGYVRIGLQKKTRKDVRLLFVHRLVAEAFIDNVEGKPFVNHRDENKSNNRVDNLEWCTHLENVNYGTRNSRIGNSNRNSKYFSKRVVCTSTNVVYESMKEASRKTGVFVGNISNCCNGKRKTAGGFKWAIA